MGTIYESNEIQKLSLGEIKIQVLDIRKKGKTMEKWRDLLKYVFNFIQWLIQLESVEYMLMTHP